MISAISLKKFLESAPHMVTVDIALADDKNGSVFKSVACSSLHQLHRLAAADEFPAANLCDLHHVAADGAAIDLADFLYRWHVNDSVYQ